MNKRGDEFMEKVLSIIISVLCIILLIYLAVRFYSIRKQDVEIARTNLENIKDKIDYLASQQEVNDLDYFITGPKNWALTSYEVVEGENEPRPTACLESRHCICMCPSNLRGYGTKGPLYSYLDAFLESCNNDGICLILDYGVYPTNTFWETTYYQDNYQEKSGRSIKMTKIEGGFRIDFN